MVSTSESCTDNSPMTPNPSVSTKNPSARKSLYQFTETFYFKHKTSVRSFGAAKAKHKAIKKETFCGQTFQSAVVIQK